MRLFNDSRHGHTAARFNAFNHATHTHSQVYTGSGCPARGAPIGSSKRLQGWHGLAAGPGAPTPVDLRR